MESHARGTAHRAHRPPWAAISDHSDYQLHYAETVEADVYQALRERIGLFESVVGRLQPILARLPTLISGRVLEGKTKPAEERRAVVADIERQADQAQAGGFDIDAVTDADLEAPMQLPSPVTMEDLDRVISTAKLLPAGIEVRALGPREYAFNQPGLGREVRVSSDPAYYEQNADTIELWSPGNPTFPAFEPGTTEFAVRRLAELLDGPWSPS